MKEFKLDLSKFKKTKSDKNSSTLQHKDGHSLTIAHNALNSKMREQLESLPMADGGEVRTIGQIINYPGSGNPKPQPKPEPKMYAEAGEVLPQDPEAINYDQESSPGFNSGIQVAENSSDAPSSAVFKDKPEPFNMDKMLSSVLPVSALKAASEVPQSSVIKYPEEQQPQTENKPTGGPEVPQTSELTPSKEAPGVNSPETPKTQPKAQSYPAIDTQQLQPQQPKVSPQQVYQFTKDSTKNELSSENKAWEQDLNNGHIAPKTYSDLFADKSTLGKVGTIFGLMLSGAGAGLTGQPNALLGMMDKTIANDLEAQKQSKGNAQNFLRLNQQNQLNQAQIKHLGQEGQLNEAQSKMMNVETNTKAWALAQAKTMQSSFHSLVGKVEGMPEGPQKEQAKQQLGMIYSRMSEKINNLNDQASGASAYYKTLFGSPSGASSEQQFQQQMGGMRMLGTQGMERAKDMEEKHFPGLQGQASVPLNSDDRNQINDGITFQKQMDRFTDWTKKHSGDLSPADENKGKALAADLQGAYRRATKGGVYKAGEQDFISQVIDSNPTKFFNSIRVAPQLAAVKEDAAAQLDQFVKSKGFGGYQGEQGGGEAQYKTVGGIKYMRGPNGQAIPVK